jgi:hypothetical protein
MHTSVPELTRRTRSIEGNLDRISSASSVSPSVGAERRPPPGRGGDGRDDLRIRVAEDERPPRSHEIEIAISVDILDPRAPPPSYQDRMASDGAEGAHRAVHPARDGATGAAEGGAASVEAHRVFWNCRERHGVPLITEGL